MRRILYAVITAVCLCTALTVTAFAEPDAPVCNSASSDYYNSADVSPAPVLSASFTSLEGGELTYQWYVSDTDDMTQIRAIDGACGPTYTIPTEVGVKYYCVAAWNVFRGMTSQPTYSRLIRVQLYDPGPEVIDIEVVSPPDRVVYQMGEDLDPRGLHVRVITSEGYINSYDGENIHLSVPMFDMPGPCGIRIHYGDDASVFVEFDVTIEAHAHEYSEWMVTTQPTCAEEGIRVRECDCGDTQRELIPATGEHIWNEGVQTEGEILYSCTNCDEIYTEAVIDEPAEVKPGPTVGINSDSGIDDTDSDSAPEEGSEDVMTTGGTPHRAEEKGFPWWTVIVAASVAVIGIGVGITLLVLKRKKTG